MARSFVCLRRSLCMPWCPGIWSGHSTLCWRPFHPNLCTVDFGLVRQGACWGTLRPLYEGPFRVLQHGDKGFFIDFDVKPETLVKGARVDVSRSWLEHHAGVRLLTLLRRPLPGCPLTPSTPSLAGGQRPSVPLLPDSLLCTRRGQVVVLHRREDFDYGCLLGAPVDINPTERIVQRCVQETVLFLFFVCRI